MSTVVENIENPSTRRQFVHPRLRLPRLERNAIAVVSTAMISALLATAVAAQQTQPKPQQAPTTTTVPASPEPAPAIASWQQAVVARLARFQRYPAQAKGATGIVNLSFSIDRQGHVLNSQIVKSSGSAVLDAEALSLLTRAAPLPAPPAAVPDSDLTFILPIRFGLR
jgi:periplasmic protein TonB